MRRFPCPYCRGRGEWIEPILDDGSGPTECCFACSRQGFITVGSEDHRSLVQNSLHGWLNRTFVRNGDDWDCDDKWRPTWNAAFGLATLAVDLLFNAKMVHYFGDNDPHSIHASSPAQAVIVAEEALEKEHQARRLLRERVLEVGYASPGWIMAMADCYGGEYERKALAMLETHRGAGPVPNTDDARMQPRTEGAQSTEDVNP